MDRQDLPPIVAEWVKQLTSPEMIALLTVVPTSQIDVTLSAAKGKVRRLPRIVLDGGSCAYTRPHADSDPTNN